MPKLMEYKFPESYDTLRRDEQLNKLHIIANELNLKKQDLLLDIGCGTGLSKEVFDCHIVGIDPEPSLLNKATFQKTQSRAELLPFKDKSFDAVIAVTSLHNVHDIARAIDEIKRVGKGKFAFSVLRKSARHDSLIENITRKFAIEKIIQEKIDTILLGTI